VPLTRAEFDRGIDYWLATTWPRDFHASFYREMTAVNPNGTFDDTWWSQFLPVLRAWRATRPRGSDYLTDRARQRFPALSQAWTSAVSPHLGVDFTSLEWRQIEAFPRVVAEIKDYFQERIDYALSHAIKKEKLILDPGIGFGKRLEDNIAIIRNLKQFAAFDLPVLVGLSRKSFLGLLSGEKVPEKREAESLAANLLAVGYGASILRVHDVAATVKALKVWQGLA